MWEVCIKNYLLLFLLFFRLLDDTDREALRLMKGLRVSFTEREDAYILLADIVRTIMNLSSKGKRNFARLVVRNKVLSMDCQSQWKFLSLRWDRVGWEHECVKVGWLFCCFVRKTMCRSTLIMIVL